MSEQIEKISFQVRIVNFLNNNKKLLLIIFTSFLIIISIALFYKNAQTKKDAKIAEQYIKAKNFVKSKNNNKAKEILENIINDNHKFYSALALYILIENEIEKDDQKILTYFDKIVKNKSIDKNSIDLIKIKKALFLFSTEDEDLLIKTLNPIINSNSVWRKQAINLIADYFLSKGENIKAEEYYKLLVIKKGQ